MCVMLSVDASHLDKIANVLRENIHMFGGYIDGKVISYSTIVLTGYNGYIISRHYVIT